LPVGGDQRPARAGSVGYWAREWRDQPVYELGWAVLPAYRGKRLATATLLGETNSEYPPGHLMRANDWQLDLTAPPADD
jgi:hypothetical protein